MARVNLRLLGSLEVTTPDGTRVDLPTRKSAALLCLLARLPGRRLPRARLAAMLWGESGERQARANLRQALRLLRRALPAPCIRGEGDTLVLDPAAAEVDVARFEALAREPSEPALEQAAALYGGALLDGIGLAEPLFRDWLETERAELAERALEVLLHLLHQQVARNDGERAVGVGRRLLALDPLREDVHRVLMRLHLEAGSRGQALRQYRACRAVLQRELGCAPSAETEALARLARGDAGGASGEADREAAATAPFLSRPAVAVLPFTDLTDPPAGPAFVRGLSADLITALAAWHCFPVVDSGLLPAPAESADLREVAGRLEAAYLLHGTVRRVGSRLRITARLVEGAGGRHLWADRFDFEADEMPVVQEAAARRIAAVVEPEIERAAWGHSLGRQPEGRAAVDPRRGA